ncbi:helix-loop-helix DNA-binding domain-containing transcription factor [Phycomyces blakesleeanus]|uniref:Helix-loop-helix DNA-binding domain-containing transcription factor n=2 Tax=Phycomyces blakesleeanus TaxID=4837 RepID=A0A167PVX6_PHYB8|nr:helix-loop-helix DNA-binding domain-containing transcription factor [Phycomyces blakesleeanus NRRL 1555(-)]OAD78629.1 helix-loop-helix DNA-binding domain-containing transcription factor [Phycomyces blakesleeanus NRRL 1555(-)]|eukprot:XP_018296669.1 helix-loop-helix DNA-binding domain-containing transcription factor [Phycomyces blakesleeanus NRRL 1555(-)]
MSSEKFRINSTGRPFRHSTNNFISTFSTSSPYSIGMPYGSSMTLDESSQCEKRTAHNALERQRREHLNTKFQQLAHALPTLQTERRPSKTMIVARSLDFVSNTILRESDFKAQILELRKENERLRKQALLASQALSKKRSSPLSRRSSVATTIVAPVQKKKAKKSNVKGSNNSPTEQSKEAVFQLSPPPTPETTANESRHPNVTSSPTSTLQIPQIANYPPIPEIPLMASLDTITENNALPAAQQQHVQQLQLQLQQHQHQHQHQPFIPQDILPGGISWPLDTESYQAIDELAQNSMNQFNSYLSPSEDLMSFNEMSIYPHEMISLPSSVSPLPNTIDGFVYPPLYMPAEEASFVYNGSNSNLLF